MQAELHVVVHVMSGDGADLPVGHDPSAPDSLCAVRPRACVGELQRAIADAGGRIEVASGAVADVAAAARTFVKTNLPGTWDLSTTAFLDNHIITDEGWTGGGGGNSFGFAFPLQEWDGSAYDDIDQPITIDVGGTDRPLAARYLLVVQSVQP